jgi:hypothetical protein
MLRRDLMGRTDNKNVCMRTANAELQRLKTLGFGAVHVVALRSNRRQALRMN